MSYQRLVLGQFRVRVFSYQRKVELGMAIEEEIGGFYIGVSFICYGLSLGQDAGG